MPTKELLVLCDGTGDSPEAVNKTTAPDNVQFTRDIVATGLPGRQSVVKELAEGWEIDKFKLPNGRDRVTFYMRGLGAPQLDANGKVIAWSWRPRSFFENAEVVYRNFKATEDEIVASGIIDKVAFAYRFLVQNYNSDDLVYLFGFSRGSYTLHLLITVIDYIGLLDRKKFATDALLEQAIEQGFKLYNRNMRADHPDNPVQAFKAQNCLPRERMIHFLGAWDCVPGLVAESVHESRKLSDIVSVARHALAIDERRPPYAVQVWEASPTTDSLQMWMRGSHCNIGGSFIEYHLSNVALQWMLHEAMTSGLYIPDYVLGDEKYAGDPMAMQHDSFAESVQTGGTVVWSELFDVYRRRVAQTATDERIHETALDCYGKEVSIMEATTVRRAVWAPSNFSRTLVAFANSLEAPRIDADMVRDRTYSDEEISLMSKGAMQDKQDNNELATTRLRWCPKLPCWS